MSWEWGEISREVCACGKGYFVVEDGSDEWGKTAIRGRIECSGCIKTHVVREHHSDYAKVRAKSNGRITFQERLSKS
jgi:hypothetical protein